MSRQGRQEKEAAEVAQEEAEAAAKQQEQDAAPGAVCYSAFCLLSRIPAMFYLI